MVENWLDDIISTEKLLRMINPRNESHIIGFAASQFYDSEPDSYKSIVNPFGTSAGRTPFDGSD